jgi:branched-chain amino acid transport system ATP-binding protein
MLEVKDLCVAYGGHVALADVSLRLDRGETVVILGANGDGKSTLLKTIAGVMRPSAGGRILLDGQGISRLRHIASSSAAWRSFPRGAVFSAT